MRGTNSWYDIDYIATRGAGATIRCIRRGSIPRARVTGNIIHITSPVTSSKHSSSQKGREHGSSADRAPRSR